MGKQVIVPDKYTSDDVNQALAALERQKTRQAVEKEKRQSPEAKDKQKAYNLRKRIKEKILLKKAEAAGIKITDEEVSAAILKRAGK